MPGKYVSESRLAHYDLPLSVNWPNQPPQILAASEPFSQRLQFHQNFQSVDKSEYLFLIFNSIILAFLGLSLGRNHSLISKRSQVSKRLLAKLHLVPVVGEFKAAPCHFCTIWDL